MNLWFDYLKFRVRRTLSKFPEFFRLLYCTNEHIKNQLIANCHKDIVIEGFPRSGNTHCVALLQLKVPALKIAHHMHSEAQIKLAIKYKIPVLVIVRNPKDSISSLVVREKHIRLVDAIRYYCEFYEFLYENREFIMFAHFEEVIKDKNMIFELVVSLCPDFAFNYDGLAEVDYVEEITRLNKVDGGDGTTISFPSAEKDTMKFEVFKKINDKKVLLNLFNRAQLSYENILA